jgi:hypothetical protein
MGAIYKILGQTTGSLSDVNLYTVPIGSSSILSTVTICNTSVTASSYRLAAIPSGSTLANKHYIAYETSVSANDTTALTLGITLGSEDKLNIYGSGSLSFSVFGSQLS